MADSMDLVQQRVEEERQRHIHSARNRKAGASSMECESCGIAIPEQRRAAVPGCDLCVTCQEIAELKGKHYVRGAV
ncbi:TraR/DksA family transcriptional regulator [Citrobacter portucalensis]|uniref:TraR/DksA family transcriptional regulator n=1 Tax=Citrobacter portucalensis TaxID=1639133 RepID=UPI003896C0C6